MTTWTYGEAGEYYSIERGQVWKMGNHYFICSDLMDTRLLDEVLDEKQPPTLLYCDPPWGQALANGFRTKAGLDKATYRWEELYHRIAMVGHSRGLPVWIEGSKIESRDGIKIPDAIRGPITNSTAYFRMTYYKKNPAGLYYDGPEYVPWGADEFLEDEDDENTPGLVMDLYGPGVVVDPCAGQGLTSRHAAKRGWGSVNNELSTYRMSAAMFYLRQFAPEIEEPRLL